MSSTSLGEVLDTCPRADMLPRLIKSKNVKPRVLLEVLDLSLNEVLHLLALAAIGIAMIMVGTRQICTANRQASCPWWSNHKTQEPSRYVLAQLRWTAFRAIARRMPEYSAG